MTDNTHGSLMSPTVMKLRTRICLIHLVLAGYINSNSISFILINCQPSFVLFSLQVADKVRRSWQEIGTYLGYSYQQLQDYKMAHHDSMKDRLFSILCDWKTKEGKNATFVALVDACTKAKAGGAVKKILGVK